MKRWVRIGVAVAVVAGLVWAGVAALSGDQPLDDAGLGGYRGLRILLEERGATVSTVDADEIGKGSIDDYDVVFVLEPDGVDRDLLARWHQYVAAGGRLVLGQPDQQRPVDDAAPETTVEVAPGSCTLPGGEALPTIHGAGDAHHIHDGETSCYGNTTAALVTSATCLAGTQVTLSSPAVFDNETMGAPTDERPTQPEQRGNAALAVALLAPDGAKRIGVVDGSVPRNFSGDTGPGKDEPKCGGTYSEDALWQDPTADGSFDESASGERGGSENGGTLPGGSIPEDTGRDPGGSIPQGTIPEGGTPGGSGGEGGRDGGSGSGQQQPGGGDQGSGDQSDGTGNESDDRTTAPPSIWDFLSPGLKLALAQLFAVLVWYAWRRSRRRGVVVQDEVPVELRSARLVEAVGALRRRGGESPRAGDDLRQRTREHIAGLMGLPADAPARDVAAALAPRIDRPVDDLTLLLGGPPVTDEAELVSLANRLHAVRDALAATLATPGGTGGRP